MNSQPTFLFLTYFYFFLIMTILSKGYKPDNFESHNSLKLGFTNTWDPHSNFVECEPFFESKSPSPDILALYETNLDDSVDSGNFSVRVYLPLIWKNSATYMYGLAVYVTKGLPFAQDLSLENYADSYLCFQLALLHSVPYFFFFYWSSSLSLCTIFYSILSNIDEVLLINSSANMFVFGYFSIHHKDWLINSGGTDSPVELSHKVSIYNDLIWMVNCSTQISDCDCQSPGFLICLFLLMLLFVLEWLSLHWKILIMLFPLTFYQTHNGMPCFIVQYMTILMLIGMVSVIIWEMFHGRISRDFWADWFQQGVWGRGRGCDSPSLVQGKALVGSNLQSSQKLQWFSTVKNHLLLVKLIQHFFRWGTHLYVSLFPSAHPSICPCVHHTHFWGTIHHLIIIFVTLV